MGTLPIIYLSILLGGTAIGYLITSWHIRKS